MKWFFVIYFLYNGVYYPGDILQPDGWSSLQFDTYQECMERKQYYDNYSKGTELERITKSVCQIQPPTKPLRDV